ncbi:hypothetical protein P4388_31460 [Bacillus thuringiensis]|nr:hypothetical protein [Bacillus pacificus]MED3353035.1 hypothetical protein [Bacillus thuringiensis]
MAGVQREPNTAQSRVDRLRSAKSGVGTRIGGNILNHGFIAFDSYSRIKDGESAPVAVGKALLTNAAFSLVPGGIVGAMAVGAVMAAPEIMNQLDVAAGVMNQKKKQFGGNFQQTESQMSMMQTGLSNMQNARTHFARRMANHAAGAQKVY